jgi:hypothetical protein
MACVCVLQVLRTVEPVEFCGKAGDVLLMHGWTVHSAGLMQTDAVRCAVIQDINKVQCAWIILTTANCIVVAVAPISY